VYRQGEFGIQYITEGQFWSPQNPASTTSYANQFGTPGTDQVDWIMGGTVKPGTSFVTRPAPGIGINSGGAIEVVTPPEAVRLDFFHMP
jgi:hypothetical protein